MAMPEAVNTSPFKLSSINGVAFRRVTVVVQVNQKALVACLRILSGKT